MKKSICMMLAVLMTLMSAGAFAAIDEKVADAFSQTWVSEDNDGYTVDIIYDEESRAFEVVALRVVSENEDYSIEFGKCIYDADQNALICTSGVLTHEISTDGKEEDISEETATGISATLSIDGENRLNWTGSGEVIPDQVCTSLAEDPFAGEWASGDILIYVDRTGTEYDVSVTKEVGEVDEICWDYLCTRDGEKLTGTGTKSTETFVDGGESVSETFENTEGDAEVAEFETVVRYSDGKATFTMDGDALIWEDAKEDAGAGMRFARVTDDEE